MHDWTLVSIFVDWRAGTVRVDFLDNCSEPKEVLAEGFTDLHVPKIDEWEGSVSVNEVTGPELRNDYYVFEIEVQSGDRIRLEAKSIYILP